jgi:hypothetical protein
MVPGFAFSQVSTMKCEPLDPRANISKETETKINASVKTVLKIVQAGGEVQKKAKEEIQNIPATATSRDQIQARWIYLFVRCYELPRTYLRHKKSSILMP